MSYDDKQLAECQQQLAPDSTMTFEGFRGRRKRRRAGSTKKPAFNLDARSGVCFFADPSHFATIKTSPEG